MLALSAWFVPCDAQAASAQGGIGFVAVADAEAGEAVSLVDGQGGTVASGTVDALGSYVFRELPQGESYEVQLSRSTVASLPVRVRRFEEIPEDSFYSRQALVEGYQYVEMRDGTTLAVMVRAPLGQSLADGPFPTVIEYSGYDPANPGELEATPFWHPLSVTPPSGSICAVRVARAVCLIFSICPRPPMDMILSKWLADKAGWRVVASA